MFANELTPTQLVDALHTVGVPFVRGGSGARHEVEPSVLTAALAASGEARLRLALIPLLLSHPAFAAETKRALHGLSPAATVCRHWVTRSARRTTLLNRQNLADAVLK